MNSKEIFKDVNINSINFINNKNDIKIDFIDSLSTGVFCGYLIFLGIKDLKMRINEDDDLEFPQFICDVIAENRDGKIYVSFLGGNYEIDIVCTDMEIFKK